MMLSGVVVRCLRVVVPCLSRIGRGAAATGLFVVMTLPVKGTPH
jgi:hypothetical protein